LISFDLGDRQANVIQASDLSATLRQAV